MLIIKIIFVAIIAFVSFQYWQHFQHVGQFDTVFVHEPRAAVTAKLGAPFSVYDCAGTAASPYNLQQLCVAGIAEVDAFETCSVPPICPGWNSIGFDAAGEMVSKTHYKP